MPKIIDYLVDCLTLILFFRHLAYSAKKGDLALGLLFLIPIAPLYITFSFKIPLIIRTLLRICSSYLFIRLMKDVSRKRALYFSVQFTCFMVALQSVRPFLAFTILAGNITIQSIVYDVIQVATALLVSELILAVSIQVFRTNGT